MATNPDRKIKFQLNDACVHETTKQCDGIVNFTQN